MSDEGKFILKKKTSFSALEQGLVTELPESDLCFQDKEHIYQFKFEKPEEEILFEIKPGFFMLARSTMGIDLRKMELKQRNLLESVSNTQKIMKEAKLFFSKLDVYEKLNRPKKRSVLLYSSPGMGKTSAIEKVCADLSTEDKGTVVIVWPTSAVDSDDVAKFLTSSAKYTSDCTRVVLIMEDIGGAEYEGGPRRAAVDSGMLNLLDGVGVTFRLPTFIIATTNHPENLLESLADRPGRFDLMVKLTAPSHAEKIHLMEFIAKRPLNDEEKEALGSKGTEEFSVAHLEEIAVRSLLHDKSYKEVVKELVDHKELFNRDFEEEKQRLGFS